MEETTKFNIYGDEKSNLIADSVNSSPIDIEIDLSQGSLYSLITPIREFLRDKPEDRIITIYLVCGQTYSPDVHLFVEFLKSVSNPLKIVFRGIIHMDFVSLFLDYPNSQVDSKCKLIYSKSKLHNFMKQLLQDPLIFRTFLERFIDHYHKLEDGVQFDVTEMKIMGIQIETF